MMEKNETVVQTLSETDIQMLSETNVQTLSEEDKIIINYLIERQNQIDASYDAQNAKISQILTIDGVIFGIIAVLIDKFISGNQAGTILMIIGILLIIGSISIGIWGYSSLPFEIGFQKDRKDAEAMINEDSDNSPKIRLSLLKKMILDCLYKNEESLSLKVLYCDISLGCQMMGIFVLLIGSWIIAVTPKTI